MMETQNTEATPNQPIFQIIRLYTKDRSFKFPHAPAIFKEEWKPEIQLELQLKHEKVEADQYEVILVMHINARLNKRTAFSLDLQQAGIFEMKGFSPDQTEHLLNTYCPNIIFPYARKVIADITLESSLPPLVLAPINFDALYQEQKKERTEKNFIQETTQIN